MGFCDVTPYGFLSYNWYESLVVIRCIVVVTAFSLFCVLPLSCSVLIYSLDLSLCPVCPPSPYHHPLLLQVDCLSSQKHKHILPPLAVSLLPHSLNLSLCPSCNYPFLPFPLYLWLPSTTVRWIVSPPHKREYFLLPTGAGSILYRPKFFHPIVFDRRLREYTKAQDDITFRLGTIHTHTHIHTHIHTYRYTDIYIHPHTHTSHIQIHRHIHTPTHTHTSHIQIHKHIHTHTVTQSLFPPITAGFIHQK